ncbi:hypothetical protein ACEQPO_10210 [Bacillus sp. SL00103]
MKTLWEIVKISRNLSKIEEIKLWNNWNHWIWKHGRYDGAKMVGKEVLNAHQIASILEVKQTACFNSKIGIKK